MKVLLFIIFCLNLIEGHTQLQSIPISKVNSVYNKQLRCIDSTGEITSYCPLYLDGFSVRFYTVLFNAQNNEVQLIGRVCVADKKNSPGISDVEIFKAEKVDAKLLDRMQLGVSTSSPDFISNSGFFDITVKIKKGQSLFFYHPGHFVAEYFLSRIVKTNNGL